jgi:cell division protein FtsZ
MREVRRHTADDAKLFLGVTTVSDPSTPLSVTLFGNYSSPIVQGTQAQPAPITVGEATPTTTIPAPAEGAPAGEDAPVSAEGEPVTANATEADGAGESDTPHDPSKPAGPKKKSAKQETLQFESTTRGRFDKSEPTIVEGEDLDVPTFLRARKPN